MDDLTRTSKRLLFYDELEEYERTIAQLTRFLVDHPENEHALSNRGRAYLELGMGDEAKADLDEAVRVATNNHIPFVNRAELREKMGDLPGAIADLSGAIEVCPSERTLYVQRGYRYAEMGMKSDALADLDIAAKLGLDPNRQEMLRSKIGAV